MWQCCHNSHNAFYLAMSDDWLVWQQQAGHGMLAWLMHEGSSQSGSWPSVSCVCLQEALQQYSAVFSWLLCLKRVARLMRELWSDLGSVQQTLHASLGSQQQTDTSGPDLSSPAVQQWLRKVQLFRHEAAHLTGVLQAYMQGQLLGRCWQQLQNSIQVGLACTGACTA